LNNESTKAGTGWGRLLALGVLILMLGIVAMILPVIAALAANFYPRVGFPAGRRAAARGCLSDAQGARCGLARDQYPGGYPAALEGVLAIAFLLGLLILSIGTTDVILAFETRPARG